MWTDKVLGRATPRSSSAQDPAIAAQHNRARGCARARSYPRVRRGCLPRQSCYFQGMKLSAGCQLVQQQITPSPADLVDLPPCTSSATTTGQPVPSPSLVRLSSSPSKTRPGCCTTSSGGLSRCCSLPVRASLLNPSGRATGSSWMSSTWLLPRLHCPLMTAASSAWIHRLSTPEGERGTHHHDTLAID